MDAQDIKRIRELLGFTREEFAQLLGTHMTTIYRWEMGISPPDKTALSYLHAIQEVLKQQQLDNFKQSLREALIVGGALLAIYTLLKFFFQEKK